MQGWTIFRLRKSRRKLPAKFLHSQGYRRATPALLLLLSSHVLLIASTAVVFATCGAHGLQKHEGGMELSVAADGPRPEPHSKGGSVRNRFRGVVAVIERWRLADLTGNADHAWPRWMSLPVRRRGLRSNSEFLSAASSRSARVTAPAPDSASVGATTGSGGSTGKTRAGTILKKMVIPNRPTLKITDMDVQQMQLYVGRDGGSPIRLSLKMNAQLRAVVAVRNANNVQLEASDLWLDVVYEGKRIGRSKIPALAVPPQSITKFNLPVTIKDFPIVQGPNYAALVDAKNQKMPLNLFVNTLARVRYQRFPSPMFKVTMACTYIVNPVTRKIVSKKCGSADIKMR